MLNSDKSKYLKGALPGPDSVLYIGDMTKGGDDTVIVVTAAANKNNKALDVVVGDAWLIVEGLSNDLLFFLSYKLIKFYDVYICIICNTLLFDEREHYD